jgi:hypothetical protein
MSMGEGAMIVIEFAFNLCPVSVGEVGDFDRTLLKVKLKNSCDGFLISWPQASDKESKLMN